MRVEEVLSYFSYFENNTSNETKIVILCLIIFISYVLLVNSKKMFKYILDKVRKVKIGVNGIEVETNKNDDISNDDLDSVINNDRRFENDRRKNSRRNADFNKKLNSVSISVLLQQILFNIERILPSLFKDNILKIVEIEKGIDKLHNHFKVNKKRLVQKLVFNIKNEFTKQIVEKISVNMGEKKRNKVEKTKEYFFYLKLLNEMEYNWSEFLDIVFENNHIISFVNDNMELNKLIEEFHIKNIEVISNIEFNNELVIDRSDILATSDDLVQFYVLHFRQLFIEYISAKEKIEIKIKNKQRELEECIDKAVNETISSLSDSISKEINDILVIRNTTDSISDI